MSRVRTEIAEGVATVVLDDPDRANALDAALSAELATAIRAADADADVGALVVTGAGRAFCAGGNLGELLAATNETADAAGLEARRRRYLDIYAPFLALREARVPTIAAVNGAAVGAGLNLVLAADVAVAGRAARFLSGFLRIGLHPGGGNTHMLTERVGPQVAAAMTLFGEPLDGAEAERVGLVFRCVEDAELRATVARMAAAAAAAPSGATLRTKETLKLSRRVDYDTALAAEVTAQIWTTTQPESAALLAQAAQR